MPEPSPKVSLIFTVLNERASLPELLDSIAAQTRRPDEVVVCDGGSTDGTLELLRAEQRFPLRVIEAPGANIARGRNLAIRAAAHPVIACTDAGVRLHPLWLDCLCAHFTAHDNGCITPHAVAGFFVSDPRTTFEVALGATVLPAYEDVRIERFMPSSRSVAFTKAAWEAVGGYPEWLDYCEDVIFDLKLRRAFGEFVFEPCAVAYYRPRTSLRAFFVQYYRYARGDGKANLFLRRHLVRYSTYLVGVPLLALGFLMGAPSVKALSAALFLLGAAAYTRAPYRRLRLQGAHLPPLERAKATAWVPLIRLVGDLAKMLGYPAGVWWRLRHQHQISA
ncbi:MAG: glycosyltransferase [Thermoflexales bacterium]|nr:glycosyltransferase [Thermoflexales bacterium]MCX7938726.1 glycosyltransferase [Thermoflexales bacterium]MDW8293519.1 glycosyltransferase [Anaerolineae bacterium]